MADGSMTGTGSEVIRVPVFQLLQWKYAVQLEAKGIRVARRSVTAHAMKVLHCKRAEVARVIQEMLDSWERQRTSN